MEELDLPDERHDAEPVGQQREEEQRAEERQEANDLGAARVPHEVDEELDDQLEEALQAARHRADGATREGAEHDENEHHQPGGEDRVRDADVVPNTDHARRARGVVATEMDEHGASLLGDVDVGGRGRPVREVAGESGDEDGDAVQQQNGHDGSPHSLSSPASFFRSWSLISRSQRRPASRAASVVGGVGLSAMYRLMITNIPSPAMTSPTRIATSARFGAVP